MAIESTIMDVTQNVVRNQAVDSVVAQGPNSIVAQTVAKLPNHDLSQTVILTIGHTVTVPINNEEKPEKFNNLNFNTWQQKMLFYLTTLNLTSFSLRLLQNSMRVTISSSNQCT